jgi:hypothetical protein
MASEVVMGRPLKISWQDDETALFQRYRAEKQPDLKPRLHALWLLRQGHSLTETAKVLGVHYTSVQQWVAWYRQGGMAEVRSHRKMGQGQPPGLPQPSRRSCALRWPRASFVLPETPCSGSRRPLGCSTSLRGCTPS